MWFNSPAWGERLAQMVVKWPVRLYPPIRGGLMAQPEIEHVAPWVERLARIGYAAKAFLYITIGILAAQAGLGRGGRATDTDGALRLIYGAALGRIILLAVAAGLLGYALWRLVEAILDAEGRGNRLKGIA